MSRTVRLFFKVSNDKYELPIGVCEMDEIETVLHNKRVNVSSAAHKYQRGQSKTSRYRTVEIEEEKDDEKPL